MRILLRSLLIAIGLLAARAAGRYVGRRAQRRAPPRRRAGMRVRAGSILGYVGNTGNAATTPPHLHYGIYTAAGAINPYPLLRADARHIPTRARLFDYTGRARTTIM
jgi:hypothetical protein